MIIWQGSTESDQYYQITNCISYYEITYLCIHCKLTLYIYHKMNIIYCTVPFKGMELYENFASVTILTSPFVILSFFSPYWANVIHNNRCVSVHPELHIIGCLNKIMLIVTPRIPVFWWLPLNKFITNKITFTIFFCNDCKLTRLMIPYLCTSVVQSWWPLGFIVNGGHKVYDLQSYLTITPPPLPFNSIQSFP